MAVSNPPLTFNAWLRWDLLRSCLDATPDIRSFLEIGCGEGALGARLAARYAEYHAYEPDVRAARVAGDRIGSSGKVVETLLPPAPERTFDAAGAFEVLEHLADDGEAVGQWKRWLRPGGWLFLSVPAGLDRFGPADRSVGHYRRYDRDGLHEVLSRTGFVDVEVHYYGFPLGYVLEWGRNLLAPPPEGSREERSKGSGRFLQPPDGWGWLTRFVTVPFRLAQRPFRTEGPGTGLLAAARTPV